MRRYEFSSCSRTVRRRQARTFDVARVELLIIEPPTSKPLTYSQPSASSSGLFFNLISIQIRLCLALPAWTSLTTTPRLPTSDHFSTRTSYKRSIPHSVRLFSQPSGNNEPAHSPHQRCLRIREILPSKSTPDKVLHTTAGGELYGIGETWEKQMAIRQHGSSHSTCPAGSVLPIIQLRDHEGRENRRSCATKATLTATILGMTRDQG